MENSADSCTNEKYLSDFIVDFEFTNKNIINSIDNILSIYYVLGSYRCFIRVVDIQISVHRLS